MGYEVFVVVTDIERKTVLKLEYETKDGFDLGESIEREITQAIEAHSATLSEEDDVLSYPVQFQDEPGYDDGGYDE